MSGFERSTGTGDRRPRAPVTASSTLESVANELVAPGKGILAADESFPTLGRRFAALGIKDSEETRRSYRELLFTTADLADAISGAILFDETCRPSVRSGASMTATLTRLGIAPGIKVDKGTTPLAGFPGEKMTQGLDGLRERLVEYRELGVRFAKWRAVVSIGSGLPTAGCIETNAEALALYAALSQEAGLVPIVEPEVLMDGEHTLEVCEEITRVTLNAVFSALVQRRVSLEAMLLKTGMVIPGKTCPQQTDSTRVAEATIRCLRRAVPTAVPGVVFLSGGQGAVAATERLNAICRTGGNPWRMSFSFGRALQDEAMKVWGGSAARVPAAQAALRHRARCNALATMGRYSEKVEREVGSL